MTARVWLILAHQWIAARLNATSATTGQSITTAVANGGALLADGQIMAEERSDALSYAALLDNYNNGIIGPGHGGGVPPTPSHPL